MRKIQNFHKWMVFLIVLILFMCYSVIEFYILEYHSIRENFTMIEFILLRNMLFGITIGIILWVFYKVIIKPYLDYVTALEEKNTTHLFQLKQQQNELINKSKFAAMGEMIDMIAHQWNQPLNTLVLHVNSVKMMIDSKKIKKTEFDNIIQQSYKTIEFMSQTINDFRGFLRSDKKAELIRIEDLVLKPKFLVNSDFIKHGITFNFDTYINTHQTVSLDSSKFFQIILNLYVNAIDEFIHKKTLNPTIHVTVSQKENQLFFQFSDNAGGVPSNIIHRIFDPYFSTKSKNGTGLGLYMCKRILNEYFKGDISVKNQNNHAVFTVQIELDPEEKETVEFRKDKYVCYTWNKDKNQFTKNKNCNEDDLVEEHDAICEKLNSFFIEFEVDENLNINLIY